MLAAPPFSKPLRLAHTSDVHVGGGLRDPSGRWPEMALRMLRKDLTGKPFRWPMMYQGPNALQAWARDEEAR